MAIAIIGILAAIAIPVYRAYVIRAEIGIALQHVGAMREKIEEFYEEEGRLPCSVYPGAKNPNEAGIDTGATGKVTQVRWIVHNPVHATPPLCTGVGAQHNIADFHHGYFSVSMDVGIGGKYATAFEFKAHRRSDGGLAWKCVHTMSPEGHRSTPNVPKKYLPTVCS